MRDRDAVEIIRLNVAIGRAVDASHLVRTGDASARPPLADGSRANVPNPRSHRFVVKTVPEHVLIKPHETQRARFGHVVSSPFWADTDARQSGTVQLMSNGLKSLREAKGWSQAQAAESFGYSYEGYKKIEAGKRRLTAEVIQRACEIYDVSETAVMGRSETVPLVGFVGAGNEAHYYANGDNPHEDVERPPESSDRTVAACVKGDSMYPIAGDGDLIYYDEVRTPPTDDMIGKLCVIGLMDDRVLVKRLHHGRAPGAYDLISANALPITDVFVTWAARVKWIKPR